jgi:D-sedoheptulose 7-phosphate isomerase
MKTFASSLKDLRGLLDAVAPLETPLAKAADLIAASLLSGGKILACGNGGSAADSAHFATEFTCRFNEDRKPYPALALAADAGLLTAIGNDYDFRDVFSRQVDAFGKTGDVLVAMTTSGKSRNVLDALEMARRREMHTILFTGKGGGFCKGAADVEICIPETTNTARIQEVQSFLLHVLCEELETRLPRE